MTARLCSVCASWCTTTALSLATLTRVLSASIACTPHEGLARLFGTHSANTSAVGSLYMRSEKAHLVVCNDGRRKARLSHAHADDVDARGILRAVCLQGFFENFIYLRQCHTVSQHLLVGVDVPESGMHQYYRQCTMMRMAALPGQTCRRRSPAMLTLNRADSSHGVS